MPGARNSFFLFGFLVRRAPCLCETNARLAAARPCDKNERIPPHALIGRNPQSITQKALEPAPRTGLNQAWERLGVIHKFRQEWRDKVF